MTSAGTMPSGTPRRPTANAADAEIARRLSAPQRRALLWLPASGDWRERGRADRHISSASLYAMASIWRGDPRREVATLATLCEAARPRIEGGRWARRQWRVTPLGARVRALLEGEAAAAQGCEAGDE